MKNIYRFLISLFAIASLHAFADGEAQLWPDGSPIDSWFLADEPLAQDDREFRLVDNGIYPGEGVVRTREIQAVIDKAAEEGGGTVVVTPGIFKTGALFFKPGVNLRLMPGAVLQGSDDVSDYPVVETRIEGQTCLYFPAVVNADKCDGFTITGGGSIDGNGLRAWKAFWLRRKWNKCTNKDEQRPRVLFVSNSRNVRIEGVNFQNSMFWTTHFHRCDFLKILDCRFYALSKPDHVKGPSTDGIDLDVCNDVVVRNCWISNNDDGVCLKGGKGAFADDFNRFPGNGENNRILVEGLVASTGTHTALTLGSENVRTSNVIFRNSTVEDCSNLLNLKMRVDTPQHYENIRVENVNGKVRNAFLMCSPWAQFADYEGRTHEELMSYARNVAMKNCDVECKTFFRTNSDRRYMDLEDFTFKNLDIKTADPSRHERLFNGVVFKDVRIVEKE